MPERWVCFKCGEVVEGESMPELAANGTCHIWQHEQDAAAKALLACEPRAMPPSEVEQFDREFLSACGVVKD